MMEWLIEILSKPQLEKTTFDQIVIGGLCMGVIFLGFVAYAAFSLWWERRK